MRPAIWILTALTLLSRLPFIASQPYGWDAYNYCLAVERFSPQEDMAHFPGYLNFVLPVKALFAVFGDAHIALLAWSVFASVLLAVVAYRFASGVGASLAGIADADRNLFAAIATALLVFNPLVWMYSEVALGYINGAWAGVLGFWAILSPKRSAWSWIWPLLLVGWLAGFRLEAGAMVFLWMYRARSAKIPAPLWYSAFAGGIFGVLLWLLPTVYIAGSWTAYAQRGYDLLAGSASRYVLEQGAVFSSAVVHALRAAGLLVALAGGGIILLARPRVLQHEIRKLPRAFGQGFAWWVLPVVIPLGILFLLPGYLLIVAPAIALFVAALLLRVWKTPAAQLRAAGVAVSLSILYFVFPVSALGGRPLPFTAGRIAANDLRTETLRAAFAQPLVAGAAALVFYDELYGWRAAMRDFPNVPAYQVNELPDGRVVTLGLHKRERDLPRGTDGNLIDLPESVRKIVVVPRGDLQQFHSDFPGFVVADTIIMEYGTFNTAVRI